MWCMKCNKHLSQCECPDLEERLNSLRDCPNIHVPTMVERPLRERQLRMEKQRLKEYRFKNDHNELRYAYTGYTYGCLSSGEIALTDQPGKFPFLGTDETLVEETGNYVEVPIGDIEWHR
jgi:hypothetical protein